jgi:hypothetical protein
MRTGSNSRFRRSVHPADRAPRARARRVLGDLRLRRPTRRDQEIRAEGRHSLRRPGVGVRRQRSRKAPPRVFELGVPVLGICYGMQTMAAQLGGQVESSTHREFGAAQGPADRRLAAVRRSRGQSRCAGPARARCVDEPRRSRGRGAAGIQGHRRERQRAARRHGGRDRAACTACSSIPR